MQEIIAPEHVQDPWEKKNVPGLVSGAHTDALSGDSHSGSAFGKPWLPVDTEGTVDHARQRDAP
jgi:hypothetical protein